MNTFLINFLKEILWHPIKRTDIEIERRNPLILDYFRYYQTINDLNKDIYIFFRFEFIKNNNLENYGLYYYPNLNNISILNKSNSNLEECLNLQNIIKNMLQKHDLKFYEYLKLKSS